MNDWDFSAPEESELDDNEVPRLGDNLSGRRIAFLISGGIAVIRIPILVRLLRKYGADVMVFATPESLRYTTIEALKWSSNNEVVVELSSRSEHLYPCDICLLAPATYNTINKFASGIADNAVTTFLASALGRLENGLSKILIAPTMHGSMHNSILVDALKKLAAKGVTIIPPRDEYGKDNLPADDIILEAICKAVGKPL